MTNFPIDAYIFTHKRVCLWSHRDAEKGVEGEKEGDEKEEHVP